MTKPADSTTPMIDQKFCKYYFALKEVYRLHVEYAFGESPDIPSGFSEALCRNLRGLTTHTGRDCDAVGPDNKTYEIKATGTAEGKTTMSRSAKFDVLLWLIVDFENDALHIIDIPYAAFDLETGDKRKSVTLSSVAKRHQIQPQSYLFKR